MLEPSEIPITIINHEEAFLFAHTRKENSNLARCYLDLKEKYEKLLSDFMNQIENVVEN